MNVGNLFTKTDTALAMDTVTCNAYVFQTSLFLTASNLLLDKMIFFQPTL